MQAVRAGEDSERLARLASYEIVDSGPDARFDRVTHLVCELFNAPISLISIVGEKHVWLKSKLGLNIERLECESTICAHAIQSDQPLIVADALEDPRFQDMAIVKGPPWIRFYAGVPLIDSTGFRIGMLAVCGTEPRNFSQPDLKRLSMLSGLALDALDAHRFAVMARNQNEAMKRTQAVLTANAQLGRIIDHSVNEIYIIEPESLRVLEANRRAQQNLGYSAEELKTMDAPQFKASWSRAALKKLTAPLLSGKKEVIFCKGLHRRKDGSTYPIEGIVELNRLGEQPVLVGIVIDSTAKVASEQLLEETNKRLAASELRFRRIYHETPAMVYSLTRDRRFVDASNAFLARIGYSREEVVGRPLAEFITAESERKAQSEILPQFWRDGFCKDIAYQYLTRSGETFDVEFSAIVFAQGNGPDDPVIHTVVNDVTERNRAQFELAIRERQYRAVLNDTPGLLSRLLPDTTLTFVNMAFCELFAKKPEQMLGQRLAKFMSPAEASAMKGKIGTLSFDNQSLSFEQKVQGRDGEPAWHWWSMRGYFNEIGDIAEIQLVGRDITSIKHLQIELADKNMLLERTNADLLRANESLNQFAYIASHDLQEPLRKISTFVSLLKRGVEVGNRQEIDLAMPVIVESVHRARELVADILAYSRITNGEMVREWINLGLCVQECLEVFSETITETGAEIVTQGLDVNLSADPSQLAHLLHNLLSNAFKYRAPERALRIAITAGPGAQSNALELQVEDNGIGIADAYITTIFEPFRRLHSRSQYPGSGIGLAICDTVAQRHGWRIKVDSAAGKGSTFRIVIPAEAFMRAAG